MKLSIPSPQTGRNWWRTPALSLIAALVLSACGTWGPIISPINNPPTETAAASEQPTPVIEVQPFDSPAKVINGVIFSGRVSNMPSNASLWLLYTVDNRTFRGSTEDISLNRDGSFQYHEGLSHVGYRPGIRDITYLFVIVRSGSQLDQSLNAAPGTAVSYIGSELPEGTIVIHEETGQFQR